jgi:hypothetical protein
MTPEEFTTALTNRLRARGAVVRAEDLAGLAAQAWEQGGPQPDPDEWVERILMDPPWGRRVSKDVGWLGRAVGGGVAVGLIGAITCTAALGLFILVMKQFDPSAGMALVILSFMWLPGGVLGALLGAVLQARGLRRGWLLGGALGGLIAAAMAFILPALYEAFNVGQYL